MNTDRAASVLARLLNRSRSTGENYNLLLSRFAIERLLYRLSVSPHAEHFVLKGALLFTLWYEHPHRPTRDADLLGFGPDDEATLRTRFSDICEIDTDDGVRYEAATMRVAPIREDQIYGGLRLVLPARIGNARLPVQVDIGFGDAVTPEPERIRYPILLNDLAPPLLRAYPVYTVIAEKLHAMVLLGIANTRMKDFYDLAVIAGSTPVNGETLSAALQATFERRASTLPATSPLALTPAFAADATKRQQWQAFLRKTGLADQGFGEVIELLTAFLMPPLQAAATRSGLSSRWDPAARRWAAG